MAPKILNFGLLLLPDFQWLDAAGPIDYINNHSQSMVAHFGLHASIVDKAPIINWHYISSSLDPVQPTSGPKQVPTCTYSNCPTLDYLVIPGPDPMAPLPNGCDEFLKHQFNNPMFKALLLVCTGSLAISQTGILDGLKVCSNKVALKALSQAGVLNKKVEWIGDRRWIIDGKVWSSGGITTGIDMAAEFARVHFDPEIVKIAEDVSEHQANPAQPDPFARILNGINLS